MIALGYELGTDDKMHGYMAAELYNWPPGVPIPEHFKKFFGEPETTQEALTQ